MNDAREKYQTELRSSLDLRARLTVRRHDLARQLVDQRVDVSTAMPASAAAGSWMERQQAHAAIRKTIKLLKREERRLAGEIRALRTLCGWC